MEFRRLEVKKVYRHIERISKGDDVRAIFLALYSNHLKFSMKVNGIGSVLSECVVLSIKDSSVDVSSRFPNKCRMSSLKFNEVELIEVVCDKEIVSEEDDEGGRWARII